MNPLPFPKVTDFIGRQIMPRPATVQERARVTVAGMLYPPGARLSPSDWLSAYCRIMGREQDLKPVPSADAVRAAGWLLARAIHEGWVQEAPGPRGGRGWAIAPAGLIPIDHAERRSA